MADAVFRRLIDILFDEQEAAWSSEKNVPKHSHDVKMALYKHYAGWKELSEAKMLPTKQANIVDFCIGHYLMFLPPLENNDHLVPLLSIQYFCPMDDREFERACCRIYTLLLGEDDARQLVGIGFRIESPETYCQQDGGNPGCHDFYHAQLFKRLRAYGPEFSTPEWLPDEQPSFPLWAVNPVDALLNLILTLYGAKWYKDFLRRHGAKITKGMSREFQALIGRL